tara:strand:+ start:377 stop:571 length:195 start_codon:yes stop_codon:yes gene_type:complete
MTPKEKAIDLVEYFITTDFMESELKGKQCALICVDEMIGNYEEKYKYCKSKQFLEEVKEEINKL